MLGKSLCKKKRECILLREDLNRLHNSLNKNYVAILMHLLDVIPNYCELFKLYLNTCKLLKIFCIHTVNISYTLESADVDL